MNQDSFNKARNISTYSESHLGKGRGEIYDTKLFGGEQYTNAIWELEKNILDIILEKAKRGSYLDFACGTGRVVEYLESRFEHSYGLDVSPDMLKVAREKLKRTELIEKDIFNQGMKGLENKFDVITAFRFFSNAENELKKQAINKIETMLRSAGFLFFNIHQHVFSFNFLLEEIKRFFNKDKGLRGNWLTVFGVKNLVSESSLKIVAVYSYAVLPRFFYKFLPLNIWFFLEKALISKRIFFGSHLIIVCQKI